MTDDSGSMDSTSMSASAAGIYRRHPTASLMRMGDEGLVVVPSGADQIVLNDAGTRLMEELDGSTSLAAIAETLAGEYDASPEIILADLVELVSDLLVRGAVEPAGPGRPETS